MDGDALGFSYFFRDVAVMDLIIEIVIPKIRSKRYINIWSAGCSEGQEPYTFAIKLKENLGHFAFRRLKIFATDIDNTTGNFGETIKKGIYPKEMVNRVESEILANYFRPLDNGLKYEIIPEIKNSVEFKQHDLLSLNEIRRGFDVILCKNVLMHFNKTQRVKVINMFHRALSSEGYLAMERTQNLPAELSSLFEKVTEKGQIYQKK